MERSHYSKLAIIDELTGIYNRRYLKIRLVEEIERAKRFSQPFTLLLIDLDRFKFFNDVYGHLIGDELIAQFANFLNNSIRKVDIVARYAGDEFVIILPNTEKEGAYLFANRLIEKLSQTEFETDVGRMKISISIGLATYPDDGEDPPSLFDSADKALYSAKRGGRGKVSGVLFPLPGDLIPLLIRPSFLIGREREFNHLRLLIKKVKEGEGELVIIRGETGIGKTRLAQEALKFAKEEGFLASEVRCFEETKRWPFYPIKEIVKEKIEKEKLPKRKQTKELWRNIEILFEGRRNGSVPKDPNLLRQRIFEGIRAFLERISEKRGLFLLLDDLQWADDETVNFLSYFARFLRAHPVFICGTYREEEPNPELEKLLKGLSRESLYKEIQLGRLNKEETILLVKSMIPSLEDVEKTGEAIYRVTEGNPFFVEEILKNFLDEGKVERKDGKWKIKELRSFSIPETVRDTIKRRVEKLDTETREILEIASCIGRDFDLLLLSKVSNYDEGIVLEAIEKGIKGVFIEDSETADCFSFRHPLVKEVFYSEIPLSKRRRIHEKIALTIEDTYRDSIEDVLDTLAHHYTLGLSTDKAYEYNLKAGLKAKSIFATEEAIRYFEEAGRIAEKKKKKVEIEEVYLNLGDLYSLTSKYDEALKAYTFALERIRRKRKSGSVAEIHRRMGEIMERLGEWKEALRLYRKALRIFERIHDKKGIARVYRNISAPYWRRGEYEKAKKYLDIALSISKEIDDKEEIASCYNNIGNIHWCQGDLKGALDYHLKSLRIREKLKDLYGITKSCNNLGIIYMDLGEIDTALEYHLRALKLREKIGDLYGVGMSYNNLAIAYLQTGEWDKALRYLKESLKIRRDLGDIQGVAMSLGNLGIIHLNRGEIEEAEKLFKEALELYESLNDKRGVAIILNNIGNMETSRRNFRKAEACMRKSLKITKQIGDKWMMAQDLMGLVELSLEKRDIPQAKEYMERAREVVRELADKNVLAEFVLVEAKLERRSGDLGKAILKAKKAVKLFEEIRDLYGKARSMVEIGLALLTKNRRANRYMKEGVEIFEKLGAKVDLREFEREKREILEKN